MDLVDKVIEKKKCYIYGDGNNINDIEYENYPIYIMRNTMFIFSNLKENE